MKKKDKKIELEKRLQRIETHEDEGFLTLPDMLIGVNYCEPRHIFYHFKLKEDLRKQIMRLGGI